MIETLAELPGWLLPLVVSLVVLAEPAWLAGVVLPSVASTVLLGFVAGLEVLPFWAATVIVGSAAAAGDALAFRSGRLHPRHGGHSGPRTLRIDRIVDRGWDRGEALLARAGTPVVALARWATVARTVVPRLAGASGMTWRRYLALAVPSAALWSLSLTGAGYLVGESYAQVSRYVGRGGGALLLLVLTAAGIVALGHWAGRHPHLVRTLADLLAAAAPLRGLHRDVGKVSERRAASTLVALTALVVGLLVVAAALYGLTSAALAWSGLAAADLWLAAQLSGLADPDLTVLAWVVVGVLRSTFVLVALAVLTAATCWAQRAGRPSARLAALATSLVPLATLAAAGALAGSFAPPPADPAAQDWVLGAQVPVVTAAVVLLAGVLTTGRAWAVRAAAVTVALLVALLLAAARVYLLWEPLSSSLTSLLVGAAWAVLLLATSRSPAPGAWRGATAVHVPAAT